MADAYEDEESVEDVNEALDALASASTTSHRPVDLDGTPKQRAGLSSRASISITMDAAGKLVGNAWCRRCQESLAGHMLKDPCGKCGAPAIDSIDSRQLAFADRDWLIGLFKGMNLMAVGTLILIICAFFGIGVLGYLEGDPGLIGLNNGTVSTLITFRDIALAPGGAGIYCIAIWLITKPRPDQLDKSFPRILSAITRWLFLPALAVSAILQITIALIGSTPDNPAPLAVMLSLISLPVGFIQFVGWLLMMVYLMSLAKRIPKRNLAKETLWVAIAVPATIIGGFLILLLFGVFVGSMSGARSGIQGFMLGSCFYIFAILGVFIWYFVVLFNYRRTFAAVVGIKIAGQSSKRRR